MKLSDVTCCFKYFRPLGKIIYCDFTPAYMLIMTSEQNSESKILNVKSTRSCKIGKLLHLLPVNDEINKDNE